MQQVLGRSTLPDQEEPQAVDHIPDQANPKDVIGSTKPPLDLIPPSADILEAMVLKHGADKYSPWNWRDTKVRASIYVAAIKRHMAAFLDGEYLDGDSGLPHIAHMRACCSILIDAFENDCVVDDRPPAGNAADLIARYSK